MSHQPARPDEHQLMRAHEFLNLGAVEKLSGIRDVVRSSWHRSLLYRCDPDQDSAHSAFDSEELRQQQEESPLRLVLPVLNKLLVEPANDTGLLVAVGDPQGRLLWVLGDDSARQRAERMGFQPGADWSEESVGTSAPGTALATGTGVQIRGPEHFSRTVRPWSCTAVPLRDPRSGGLLGVIDLTGDEQAVAQHSMALVRAAATAAEYEFMLHMQSRTARRSTLSLPAPGDSRAKPAPASCICTSGYRCDACGGKAAARLLLTRPGPPRLVTGDACIDLRLRHAEILLLLADSPQGLSSAELGEALGEPAAPLAEVSLRAEMVRLRRALRPLGEALLPASRPYRLPKRLSVDALEARAVLSRGDVAEALEQLRGDLLPDSRSHAVTALRYELGAQLRDAVLEHANADELCLYLSLPGAAEDTEAWRLALKILPADSPRRAGVVAHLERLEGESFPRTA